MPTHSRTHSHTHPSASLSVRLSVSKFVLLAHFCTHPHTHTHTRTHSYNGTKAAGIEWNTKIKNSWWIAKLDKRKRPIVSFQLHHTNRKARKGRNLKKWSKALFPLKLVGTLNQLCSTFGGDYGGGAKDFGCCSYTALLIYFPPRK